MARGPKIGQIDIHKKSNAGAVIAWIVVGFFVLAIIA